MIGRNAFGAVTVAAVLASAAAAQDDLARQTEETAPAVAIAEPGRPHLVDGALYWRDHALAELCGDFGGLFAKLNGSLVYRCGLAPGALQAAGAAAEAGAL